MKSSSYVNNLIKYILKFVLKKYFENFGIILQIIFLFFSFFDEKNQMLINYLSFSLFKLNNSLVEFEVLLFL